MTEFVCNYTAQLDGMERGVVPERPRGFVGRGAQVDLGKSQNNAVTCAESGCSRRLT